MRISVAARRLLSAEDEPYRLLFQSAPVAILLSDLRDRITAANPAAERLIGCQDEELRERLFSSVVAPEWRDARRHSTKLRPAVASETRYATVLLHRAGRRVPVEVLSTPLRSGGVIVGAQHFLEEAKRSVQAEDALRESEERFRGTFEVAAIGMAIVSVEGRFLKVNASLSRITGYAADELATMTFQDVTHPDDLDENLDRLRRSLAGEFSSYALDKRYRRRDGTSVWVRLTVSLVHGTGGEPAYFVTQVQDIDQAKCAELIVEALRIRHRGAVLLSRREIEVLRLIATGLTSSQAGRELSIGEETVSTHLRNAMKKIGAPTRTAAVALAIRLGVLDAIPVEHRQTG